MNSESFTGFNGLETDLASSGTGGVFVVRHGKKWIHLQNGGFTTRTLPTFASLAQGSTSSAKMRFRFILDRLPSATDLLGGFGQSPQEFHALARINSSGQVSAVASLNESSFSTETLTVGTIYMCEIESSLFNAVPPGSGGQDIQTTTVRIKSDDGLTTILTKTQTYTPFFFAANIYFASPRLGSGAGAPNRDVLYTDWWWRVDDAGVPAFPTATYVQGVYVAGQGALAAWTGSYEHVQTVPRDSTAGEQTTTTDEASTTFTHESAAALGIEGIYAVKVVAHVKAASAGNEALLLDGSEHVAAVQTTYTNASLVPYGDDFTAWSTARFDAMEFGVRNKRGVSTQVAKCYLEVLHAGPGPAPRTNSWRHKIVKYVATGSVGPVPGVGFKASKILVKKASGSSSQGAFWCEELGGTRSKVIGTAGYSSNGVRYATDDGFVLGTDASVNQSGQTYIALCIDDGGTDGDGYFARSGAFVGNNVDGRDIVDLMEPDVVLAFGGATAFLRTRDMVGDFSVRLGSSTATTNGIQALNADGFEVGTDSSLNGALAEVCYLLLRIGGNTDMEGFFAYGTFPGTGAIVQVTGVPFTPEFAFGDAATAGGAMWRSTLHHGVGFDSTGWADSFVNANGIRAFGAGTIDFGTQLSPSGNNVYWVAFNLEGEILDPVEVEFDATADQAGRTRPLIWVNWYLDDDSVESYAMVALPDPSTYYGGYKRPLILSFGEIRRALSDRVGHYEGSKWSWVASDLDPRIRTLLAGLTTRYNFLNRDIVGRMINDADRRAGLIPRVIFRGTLRGATPEPERQFSFEAEDFLSSKFSMVSLDQQIPRHVIDADSFPDAPDETIGKVVPIAYGFLSDENIPDPGFTLAEPSVVANVIGAGGSTTYRFIVTALDNRGNQAYNFDARMDHSGETGGSVVTVSGAASYDNLSGSNYIELLITAPGAHHVRIYGDVGGGGDFALLDQGDDDGGGNHHYHYGERNGVRDVDRPKWESSPPAGDNAPVDLGKGVVPVTYVGLREIASVEYHEFLVSQGACKTIHGVYQGHVRIPDSSLGTGSDLLIPGFQAWTDALGAAGYRDFNGRRYTVLYVKQGTTIGDTAADGSNPITVNLSGIEDVGDGSGDLITSLPLIYRHFVINFAFQESMGGIAGWLTSPAWEDGTLQVDEASFDAADAIAATRISGGYVGAALIGAANESTTLREALRRFNISCGVRCGFNRNSQFFISMFDDRLATLDAARSVTQVRDVIRGSFSSKERPQEMNNLIVYSYKRRYTQATISADSTEFESPDWEEALLEVEDPDSIAGYREVAKSRELDFYYVRDEATALDLAQRELMFTRYVPRLIYWRQPLSGLSIELGDLVKMTHLDGVGLSGTGFVDTPLLVERHNFDPKKLSVYMEAWDVERLFSTSFRLGDDDWAVTWTTASEEQRRIYGFLADETTGLFSDGEPGKRLR